MLTVGRTCRPEEKRRLGNGGAELDRIRVSAIGLGSGSGSSSSSSSIIMRHAGNRSITDRFPSLLFSFFRAAIGDRCLCSAGQVFGHRVLQSLPGGTPTPRSIRAMPPDGSTLPFPWSCIANLLAASTGDGNARWCQSGPRLTCFVRPALSGYAARQMLHYCKRYRHDAHPTLCSCLICASSRFREVRGTHRCW